VWFGTAGFLFATGGASGGLASFVSQRCDEAGLAAMFVPKARRYREGRGLKDRRHPIVESLNQRFLEQVEGVKRLAQVRCDGGGCARGAARFH